VVKRAHSQSGVDLSYIKLSGESTGDAGDQYTGLDRFGRIVDQRWINGSNVDVDRFKYGYDRNSNVLYKENIVNSGLSEVYTYDDLNQLASYKLGTLNVGKTDVTGSPTNAQNWDYDATGNWDSVTTNGTTQTRGANKQNEITSVSSATTPTYDNNGNLTKDENNYRFVWDAWNREVKIKNSSDTVIATNSYDTLNRKVKVVANSTTTDRLFSSNWQLLEEKAGSNTKTRNVWSPVYVDAMVSRDRDTDANGSLDERLYALQDANFNVTAITNTSGSVQEKFTETPFGVTTFRNSSGTAIGSSTKDWSFLHQGGQADIIGDLDFRNRVLSSTLGRWLSNDPLGFDAGDVNTYRYVGNGPTGKLDSFGLESEDDRSIIRQPLPVIKHPPIYIPPFLPGFQIVIRPISVKVEEPVFQGKPGPVDEGDFEEQTGIAKPKILRANIALPYFEPTIVIPVVPIFPRPKPPGSAQPPGSAPAQPPGSAPAQPPGGAPAQPPGGAPAQPPGGAPPPLPVPGGGTAPKPPGGSTEPFPIKIPIRMPIYSVVSGEIIGYIPIVITVKIGVIRTS
jgi:RHS repeat-associated protein